MNVQIRMMSIKRVALYTPSADRIGDIIMTSATTKQKKSNI